MCRPRARSTRDRHAFNAFSCAVQGAVRERSTFWSWRTGTTTHSRYRVKKPMEHILSRTNVLYEGMSCVAPCRTTHLGADGVRGQFEVDVVCVGSLIR